MMIESTTGWDENWEQVSALGRGGQGMTAVVQAKSDPSRQGVLKRLRENGNARARARMKTEVGSLEALRYRKVKVPEVFESNVQLFQDEGVELFFVMEHVLGVTLESFMTANGPLSLERAASFLIDLANTVSAAHAEEVTHRDLKPANIIVRDPNVPDLVIVDYGLSFNKLPRDDSVTLTTERIHNSFWSIGDTNAPGGNKRDPRIDVSALTAILYYLLTNEVPVQPHDANGRPPHKRDGARSVAYHLGADPRLKRLLLLFDTGFQTNVDQRFQSCHELVQRLSDVISDAPTPHEDPIALAERLTRSLQAGNRKTQLAHFKTQCEPLFTEFSNKFVLRFEKRLGGFALSREHATEPQQPSLPEKPDVVNLRSTFLVNSELHGRLRLEVAVGAKGSQLTVFARLAPVVLRQAGMGARAASPVDPNLPHREWENRLLFDIDDLPSADQVMDAMVPLLNDAMQYLHDKAE